MADVYLALYEGCQSPPQWAGGGVSRPVDEAPSTTFTISKAFSLCLKLHEVKMQIFCFPWTWPQQIPAEYPS